MTGIVRNAKLGRELVPKLKLQVEVAEKAVNDAQMLAYHIKRELFVTRGEVSKQKVKVIEAERAFHWHDALVGGGVATVIVATVAIVLVFIKPSL